MRAAGKVCVALTWALGLPALGDDSAFSAGRDLYLYARRPDGSTLTATAQTDIRLPAAAAACVNCHRRSGLGGAESSVRPLPVTGPALFAPTHARPAYDAALLHRALTYGIDAGGRPLSAVMPRYELAGADAAALLAYLQRLGALPSPGVTADEIQLATVVSDDTPDGQRDALLKVLEHYVAAKNSQSRHEGDRAAAAQRHPFGERRDRAFRRWRLAVWGLHGPAATWDAQLRDFYARQPPFALLSGATGHDWHVIHEFCERQRLPCVLPITDVPGNAEAGFYSLYYTLGSALEGRITARHIVEAAPSGARVLLVYSTDERSLAARDAFRTMVAAGRQTLIERRVTPAAPDREEWRKLLARDRPDILVAWLGSAPLAALADAAGRDTKLPNRIYTAESITPWRDVAALGAMRAGIWHVYPWQPPAPGRNQFPREQAWLRSQHLESLDDVVAARALFACHALGEGLASIESSFSRDYLLEQFEHMLDRSSMTTLLPATRLGPGQRVLSNGAYVMRLRDPARGNPLMNGEWRTF